MKRGTARSLSRGTGSLSGFLTCGCLHELARALEDLKQAGVAALILPADTPVLADVDAFIGRWRRPGERKSVRDKIAFHIDHRILLDGVKYTQAKLGDGPHVFLTGPSRKRSATMFRMAHGVMFEGLFASIKETLPPAECDSLIETLIRSTVDDHGAIETTVTAFFWAVDRGLAAGRKPVPIPGLTVLSAKQELELVRQTARRLGKELLAADFDSKAETQGQVEALGRGLKAAQRELRECRRTLERERRKPS